jgi:mannose-1-phosphate guanylyltransferase
MKIILFAGGSGKRFWPRSRKDAPKQFLNINGEKPIAREAFDRLLTEFPPSDIFISTGDKFKTEVKKMMPELPDENFIFEPSMRDTAPAVTLAVSFLNAKFPEEVIVVLWSDQIINDTPLYIKNIKLAEKLVKDENKIIFIAIPARFPSVHLGYIQFGKKYKDTGDERIQCLQFKQFEEKPSQEVAVHYLASGKYCWNPGYWVFKPKAYLDKVLQTNKDIYAVCQEVVKNNFSAETREKFSNLEKISADYVFAEKVYPDEALVLLSDFKWADAGEWISIKEAFAKSPEANVIKGNVVDMDSKDCIIHNYEDDKLVSTIGLEGFVVVNTKDVVAIFKKNDNVRLKEYLKKFEGTELEKYL